jgi:hypothetical protein
MSNLKTATAQMLATAYGTDSARVAKFLAHEQTAALIDVIATAEQVAAMNQKASMRFAQACDFALTGDVKQCDEVTSALVALVVLSSQNQVSFTDAQIIAGASKEGNAVGNVSRARLARFLPRTSNIGTITSKVSRTVGKGKKGAGMFQALGITTKGDAHSFEIANRNHPLILAYAGALSKMTDGSFDLLKGSK